MKAILSHKSALQYWRLHFPADDELGACYMISGTGSFARTMEEVKDCVPETYWPKDGPLDIMTFDSRRRGWSNNVKYHTWSSALPDNAFYNTGNMLVSSPEFVFLQMAGELTIAQLAALGCELCGTYIVQPRNERLLAIPDDAPRRRFPLTNLAQLRSFLDAAKGARNLAKAIRAFQHVVEASRSPMETVTVLQLCLPPKLGGYGLPHPTMNPVIQLDDEARRIAGRRWCEGDACWVESKLDIEYNGVVHSGAQQMKSDAGRLIALEHMGWYVLTVTSAQVFDIGQFETVASLAASRIGYRIRPSTRGATIPRVSLHEELSAWLDVRM